MSDNPLEPPSRAREQRIRERAYHLWEADGRPDGRDREFWERAEELIALEDHAAAALLPNPMTQHERLPGVTVEEAEIQENLGEVPTYLGDQGDWRETPMTKQEERAWAKGRMPPGRGDAP